MIAHLKGLLVEKQLTYFIIECGGVGYQVFVSVNTYEKTETKLGETIFITIQQIIKEDKHLLYGFYSKEEKEVFNRLIEVSGVGTNTAMVILSSLNVDEVKLAVINETQEVFKNVKGIGTKTAQRIIIDLKGKVDMLSLNTTGETEATLHNNIKQDALSALTALGFQKSSVEKVIAKLLNSKQAPSSTEDLVKQALKLL